MSRVVYDNWQRLVEATVKREKIRQLALSSSFDSAESSSRWSFDYRDVGDSSSRFSFDSLPVHGHQKDSKVSTSVNPKVLSLEDLKEKTNNFEAKASIGEGYYGSVYFAQLDSGMDVVVKKRDLNLKTDPWGYISPQLISAYASKVSTLKHENLVQFVGYFVENNDHFLVYEFASMGSLHDILHGRKGVLGAAPALVLNWMQRVRIAVDAAKGLEFLHEIVQPSIIHRDFKSSNVLLFQDFKAKVADIYLSEFYRDEYFINAVSLDYPHLGFTRTQKTEKLIEAKKSDVYRFGVLLLELLTGRNPFDKTDGERSLVTWATPHLSEDKVKQCVDPKLDGKYPPFGAAKLAAVARLCVASNLDYRPKMSIVVNNLLPLLDEYNSSSSLWLDFLRV